MSYTSIYRARIPTKIPGFWTTFPRAHVMDDYGNLVLLDIPALTVYARQHH